LPQCQISNNFCTNMNIPLRIRSNKHILCSHVSLGFALYLFRSRRPVGPVNYDLLVVWIQKDLTLLCVPRRGP
jgi:hypothetical protein